VSKSDASDPDRLRAELLALHHKRREEIRREFSRSLPLADELVDRWERARFLGFGEGASVYDSALVLGEVKAGRYTWVGPGCILDGSGGLEIGDYCSIAAGVHVYSHDTVEWALSGGKHPPKRSYTRIGHACYIGPNSIVSAGVTIGDHCLVGALSLVNRDLPDFTVAAGTPARIIGRVEIGPNFEVKIVYFDSEGKKDGPSREE